MQSEQLISFRIEFCYSGGSLQNKNGLNFSLSQHVATPTVIDTRPRNSGVMRAQRFDDIQQPESCWNP